MNSQVIQQISPEGTSGLWKEKKGFKAFGRYVFGTLGNEANIIIQYYVVTCRLLVTQKYMTLNDPDGLFGVKFCFHAGLAG